MIKLIKGIKGNKSGAAAAEYALIIAVMGALVVAAVTVLGGGITSAFAKTSGILKAA